MNSPEPHDPVGSSDPSAEPSRQLTGLESACLRQAIHDLRGPLNTASIVLDVAMASAATDPSLVSKKLSLVVQELHRVGRMLDHLVAASESAAPHLAPVDLAASLAAVSRASKAPARGVRLQFDASLAKPLQILSCASRLARALGLILDGCLATLPDGGEVLFESAPGTARIRLVLTAQGPRVLPLLDGKKLGLTDASHRTSDWFLVRALIRGMSGDIEVEQRGELGVRITLDLPRTHSPHQR